MIQWYNPNERINTFGGPCTLMRDFAIFSNTVQRHTENKFNAGARNTSHNTGQYDVGKQERIQITYCVGTGASGASVIPSRSICTSICTVWPAEGPIANTTAFYLQEKLSKPAERLFLARILKRDGLRGTSENGLKWSIKKKKIWQLSVWKMLENLSYYCHAKQWDKEIPYHRAPQLNY